MKNEYTVDLKVKVKFKNNKQKTILTIKNMPECLNNDKFYSMVIYPVIEYWEKQPTPKEKNNDF